MKDVVGFEGYYKVSEDGRVFSVRRKSSRNQMVGGKELTQNCSTNGYMHVYLSRDGFGKTKSVHRIVAEAFMGGSKLYVDHKNGDKKDNRLENLEFVTARENSRRYHSGRRELPVGVYEKGGKFIAMKRFNDKLYSLGVFETPWEASEIYQKASVEDALRHKGTWFGKYKGVNKCGRKWWGKYTVRGKQYFTKRFDSAEEARDKLAQLKKRNGHA